MALQSITEGGMEKQAFDAAEAAAAAALLPGVGATAAALGSKDHKTLSGILGAGTGTVGGVLAGILGHKAANKLYPLIEKVKNHKLQAALTALVPVGAIGGVLAGSTGAGYGTGKFVDWIADKIS